MRMYMTGFRKSTVLRFGTLELVRGDWRTYTQDLSNPLIPPKSDGQIVVSSVNIEENGQRQPVNYVLPPGISVCSIPVSLSCFNRTSRHCL